MVFRHGARNYYDTFIIPTLSKADILGLVPVSGWQHLEQAIGLGGGAIMVGIHLSSVALAGQVIAARGYRVTAAAEPVEPIELRDLLTRLRSGGGVRVLPAGPSLIRELISVLRRNEVAALVMDRDITGSGVPVSFFGVESRLPAGPALLALRTGAPILPAIAFRTTDGRFQGIIEPPVAVVKGSSPTESIRLTTERIAARFEKHIRANPGQWTIFQSLWSRTASGATSRETL
jgi:KDO2-lipid IV(A) lauroyltransferase